MAVGKSLEVRDTSGLSLTNVLRGKGNDEYDNRDPQKSCSDRKSHQGNVDHGARTGEKEDLFVRPYILQKKSGIRYVITCFDVPVT